MKDVIAWHKQYPGDWKRTWFECEKKWSSDIGCPDGVFVPFNIDAVTNSAYILIGLLYGEGDFSKTLDIATRCGQDSDWQPGIGRRYPGRNARVRQHPGKMDAQPA